ncbi:Maf family nucleotide pyrophosphatase [Flavobacterium sp. I3-2]|uniref:Maf family nucleotide pyrophosphatase n=1 Tax=Flavobacterium sp. I3-2 TaxID=2748319 RepID=UPI0015AAFEA5|nr:Maf family nucleotide pyrophosphatase [Flavobacterium sp. I3-2]
MLHKLLEEKKLILASNSPRRKHFLTDLGLTFEVQPSNVDESYPENLLHAQITDYIAKVKADFFTDLDENEIVITSDTLVWNNGIILGKPENKTQTFDIIKSLSNKTHEVISSVCLKSKTKIKIFNAITFVTFTELTDEEILYYIENFKPFDKAGAYGIQEWIGLIGIKEIKGSYTNVVGLPMEKLYHELLDFLQ